MWGKRLYVYRPDDPERKLINLELGHDQQGYDMLEVKLDKRAGDLKGKLVFALWHVGFAGTWHENETWEFTGESIAGKEVIIEWVKDKG